MLLRRVCFQEGLADAPGLQASSHYLRMIDEEGEGFATVPVPSSGENHQVDVKMEINSGSDCNKGPDSNGDDSSQLMPVPSASDIDSDSIVPKRVGDKDDEGTYFRPGMNRNCLLHPCAFRMVDCPPGRREL